MSQHNRKMFASVIALIVLVPSAGAHAKGSAVLYAFRGGNDGSYSHAGVIRDSKGNLYGTTEAGGAYGWGSVYKLAADGSETVLYSFTGGSDGSQPVGGVIADNSGNLYGTTYNGGNGETYDGAGVVFKLTPHGRETVLYTFTGGTDGLFAYGGLVADKSGNLYGTTVGGGTNGAGNIFELTAGGAESVLYSFGCGNDGCLPFTGLARDGSGNLYGTATVGGADGYGDVFKLAPDGTFTTVYSFAGGNDGNDPHAGVILDSSGNLYGTTDYGGSSGCGGGGCGTVYETTGGGTETVLHAFSGGTDGMGLYGSLHLDRKGNVYGTTIQGGRGCDYGCGTVFKITPSGAKSTVHAFTEAEGADSYSSLIADGNGYLYGTTRNAGKYGYGSVFKVKE